MITIRRYRMEDCAELAGLFFDTVHLVNCADYTEEQLDAWADGSVSMEQWNTRFQSTYTLTAECDGIITGFGNIDDAGDLDCLYVHHQYQGCSTASLLCDELEKHVQGDITVHASITAKPFFEKRGYQTIEKQQVERKGVLLENFLMVLRRNLNE